MSEPEKVEPASTRRTRALIALAMLVPLIALAAYWLHGRSRAKRLAKDLDVRAVALVDCAWETRGAHATLDDAIAFALPEQALLAGCAEHAGAAHALASELSRVRPVMDREALDTALAALSDLKLAVGAPAGVLATNAPEALETKLDQLRLATCRIAIAEEVAEYPQCVKPRERPPVASVPPPRVIVDEQTSWLEHVALSLDARKGSGLTLLLGVVQREKARATAYVASSFDAGERWKVAALECERADLGRPDAPAVSFAASGAPDLFLLPQRDDKGAFAGGTLGRLAPGLAAIRFVSDVPDLPAELEPVRAGSPVLELAGDKLALALTSRAPAGGGLLVLGKEPKLEAAPEGRLVAAFAGPPTRLVLERREPGLPLALAVVEPPDEKGRWPDRSFTELGAAELELDLARAPERLCSGSPSLLYRGKGTARLARLAPGLEVLSFRAPPGGDLSELCGACRPSLFWRSETALAAILPREAGDRQLRVDTPVLYSAPKAWRTAASACSGATRAVAYIQDGALYVQTAEQAAFGRPTLIARPNDAGAPVEVALAAFERRIVAVFRRAAPKPTRLLVEIVASDDGGRTWR